MKNKQYYIIRPDGSAVFELPYREEFVYHCLIHLLERTPDIRYTLLHIDCSELEHISLSAKKSSPSAQMKSWTGGFAGVQSTKLGTLKAKNR